MNNRYSSVHLTIELPGVQASRGSYDHFFKIDKNGDEINSIKVIKAPSFSKCHKTVKLSNDFVLGALAEPPESLKHRYKLTKWLKISENKRIALHVKDFVNSITPGHRGYEMEII